MLCIKILTSVGLILGIIGTGLIWKYGLPEKIDRDGHEAMRTCDIDAIQIAKARKYDLRANAGFTLLFVGFILQLLGTLLA